MSINYNRDTKISKLLSWILRHGADECGLSIKPDGYSDLANLLCLPIMSAKNVTAFDIRRIVANDSKNRYKLIMNEQGREEIKANQGHSLKSVDELSLIRIEDSSTVAVHGTFYKFLDSIKREGLHSMKRNFIHFSATDQINFHKQKSREKISGFRENCEILIYVDLELAFRDGIKFYHAENNVILTKGLEDSGCLPTKYFSKIIDRRTGNPVSVEILLI